MKFRKLTRGLDARTVAAFAVLLVILMAGWQLVGQREDAHTKDGQIEALIEAAETRDAEAAADRRIAAANQAELLEYTKSLAERQRRLLIWLRDNGIDIPTQFVVELPKPRVLQHAPRKKKPRAGTVDRPGKSGNAPGQRKKRKAN